jgi:signal transduction histidine kinase
VLQDEQESRIVVKDTGLRHSWPEHLARIFERLLRVDKSAQPQA